MNSAQQKLEMKALKKVLKNVQQKEENKAFTKTWEVNSFPETHDPIARVVAELEKPKKHDGNLDYTQMLRAERDAERLCRIK